MKIDIRSRSEGSALLCALVLSTVIGITLASYLTLVSRQNVMNMRSLAWNSAIPALEAGIEEAMIHLNGNGTDNLGADNWSHLNGVFVKQRSLGDGTTFSVNIDVSSGTPVIVATGSAPISLTGNASGTETPDYVTRTVRVTTRSDGMFVKGMVAKGQIDLNGNNIASDSFDSSNPLYSTSGLYDSAKAKDNGDVATNSGLVNSLSVGNANIKGRVSTGPGGSVSVGPNGSVGNAAWVEGGNSGIQPGYVSDDMNMDFPDVSAPFTSGYWIPSSGTVDGTSYNYVLGSGNYLLSSLDKKDVYVDGDAILYVTGNVKLSGNNMIVVGPGASLKMYVGGSSADLSGNGVINLAGKAEDFQYFGLPSNTSLKLSGNAGFTGVIYAPDAAFNLSGGGSNDIDFVGASITSTVTMNGHFHFHYDEDLANLGGGGNYVITSWNEL